MAVFCPAGVYQPLEPISAKPGLRTRPGKEPGLREIPSLVPLPSSMQRFPLLLFSFFFLSWSYFWLAFKKLSSLSFLPFCLFSPIFSIPHFPPCLFLHSLSSFLSMVLYVPLFPLFWSAVSFFQTKYSSSALHSHRNGLRWPEVTVPAWQHQGQ